MQKTNIKIHSMGICDQYSITPVKTNNTKDVPKSGWKKINNQGIKNTNKGNPKSLIVEIIFLSRTRARANTVLNLATSEGWNEKSPKLNHLWDPEIEIPKK